jgi:hypothetical protein
MLFRLTPSGWRWLSGWAGGGVRILLGCWPASPLLRRRLCNRLLRNSTAMTTLDFFA